MPESANFHEKEGLDMRRTFAALGALAAAATIAWSADSFAQIQSVEYRTLESGYLEGKVAAVEPGTLPATTVRMDDGSRLIVLASSLGPAVDPRPGDVVQARCCESRAGDKVVTALRVESEFQAP